MSFQMKHRERFQETNAYWHTLAQFVYAFPQAFSVYPQQVQQLFHAQQTSDGSCGIAPQKRHKHQQTPRIQTLLAP
jgi:hypothetical protein